MTTAERTAQRTTALKLANERRVEGAELKRELRDMSKSDGMRHVAVLLENPSDAVNAMRVGALLGAIKRVGPSWIIALLSREEIRASWDRRVRELSPRQRLEIARKLRFFA